VQAGCGGSGFTGRNGTGFTGSGGSSFTGRVETAIARHNLAGVKLTSLGASWEQWIWTCWKHTGRGGFGFAYSLLKL